MLGLPIWFWEGLIAFLRVIGKTTWAQNLELKLGFWLKAKLSNLKTYQEYPTSKNGGTG
jgi:hypothetical protein